MNSSNCPHPLSHHSLKKVLSLPLRHLRSWEEAAQGSNGWSARASPSPLATFPSMAFSVEEQKKQKVKFDCSGSIPYGCLWPEYYPSTEALPVGGSVTRVSSLLVLRVAKASCSWTDGRFPQKIFPWGAGEWMSFMRAQTDEDWNRWGQEPARGGQGTEKGDQRGSQKWGREKARWGKLHQWAMLVGVQVPHVYYFLNMFLKK